MTCPDCDHGTVSHEGEPGDRWTAKCDTRGGTGQIEARMVGRPAIGPKVLLRFPAAAHARVRARAKSWGCSVAEAYRRLVDAGLAKEAE